MSNRSADERLRYFEMDSVAYHAKGMLAEARRDELAEQLKTDLLSLPEMQDDSLSTTTQLLAVQIRNDVRAELREALSQYFIGIVGGENGDSK